MMPRFGLVDLVIRQIGGTMFNVYIMTLVRVR